MRHDILSLTFAALSDPTRRAILARLAVGDATVNELSEPFTLSQPAISKHIKVLESAGLISRRRIAQQRPCHLEPQSLKEISDWINHYRDVWSKSFDRLDDHLQRMKAQNKEGT